jgi:tetratricopeptide (TPR) repeat protein
MKTGLADAHQVQFMGKVKMKDQYTKKVLATAMLAFAIAATGERPAQPSSAGQAQSGSAPANQKVIKDEAEFNAYMAARNTQDPAAKAEAMEAFIRQYPQSIMVINALEQAMAGYQQAGNLAKVVEAAKRILALSPNHIRALAIVVAVDRNKATAGDQAALQESCSYLQTGLRQLPAWQKPEELTDQDFEKVRNQIADIFYGAAGFCALGNKDYTGARTYYEKAFPMDPTSLQDVYQLAVADLEMSPIDVNGLWYCSKAIALAQHQNNTNAVNGMTAYCKAKYKRYHGGEDGWDPMISGTATETALPPNFPSRIKPAPTACELAVQAVQQNDVATLSFSDMEFILSKADCSPANKVVADKVWQFLLDRQKGGKKMRFPVKVISSTPDSIDAALTDDDQAANTADVHVLMEKPMLHPPAPGSMTDIIGALSNYTPRPFMFTMEKGELPAP